MNELMEDELKCPKCGSEYWSSGGKAGAYCCRCDADMPEAGLVCLRRQLAAAQAKIERRDRAIEAMYHNIDKVAISQKDDGSWCWMSSVSGLLAGGDGLPSASAAALGLLDELEKENKC